MLTNDTRFYYITGVLCITTKYKYTCRRKLRIANINWSYSQLSTDQCSLTLTTSLIEKPDVPLIHLVFSGSSRKSGERGEKIGERRRRIKR